MEINFSPEIRSFKVSDLNPAEYNPRTIDEEALAGLAKSVAKFGLVELIIVNVRDGRNVIVGGHQRFKVVQQSGVETIDCIVVDLSVEDEKLLNLSLNNPHIQGQFIDAVSDYIAKLKEQIPDEQDILDLRLDELMGEIKATEGLTDDDAVPEAPVEPITQPGDLWLLATLKGDVLGLAGPGKKISGLLTCTKIYADDLADQILDQKKNPEWQGECTKLLYAMPTNEKLWDEYARLRADSLSTRST